MLYLRSCFWQSKCICSSHYTALWPEKSACVQVFVGGHVPSAINSTYEYCCMRIRAVASNLISEPLTSLFRLTMFGSQFSVTPHIIDMRRESLRRRHALMCFQNSACRRLASENGCSNPGTCCNCVKQQKQKHIAVAAVELLAFT